MSWLKKARGLKRISSKKLAELSGMSMNYIQKMEGGNRSMPLDTAQKLYDALGFTPEEVEFNTPQLIEQIENIDTDEICLSYVLVDGVIYFTGIADCDACNTFITTIDNAKLLLTSQNILFG